MIQLQIEYHDWEIFDLRFEATGSGWTDIFEDSDDECIDQLIPCTIRLDSIQVESYK